MKIQSKISLTSMLLIFGLLFSAFFLFLRMYTVYELKNYEEECVELNLSMYRFIDRNLSLFLEEASPSDLTEQWYWDLKDFSMDLERVLYASSIRQLSEDYNQMIGIRRIQWLEMESAVINPLVREMDQFSMSLLMDKGDDIGFYKLLGLVEKEGNLRDAEHLLAIQDYQEELYELLSVFSFSVDALIEKADEEINGYIRESILITGVVVSLILLLTLLTSFRFTRSLVVRINETNRIVQNMSDGILEFEGRDKDRDEFDELLRHYQNFSRVLTDRLDSLKFLLQDIGNSLGNEADIETLQETIVELGMDSISADSGLLFLADAESGTLKLAQRTGFCPPPFRLEKNITMIRSNVENYFETHPIDRDTPVLGALMASGAGLFVKDNETERAFPDNSDSYEWLFISSLIALPLVVSNRLLGVLAFYKSSPGETFSDLDYTFIQAFSDYTAQSIDNVYKYRSLLENREIQREIDVAAGIQKRLLPEIMPEFRSGSARIYSLPARGISGDYFDAIRLDEKRILYTVCDVAGKGVPASMLMIMIRTILHTISIRHKSADSLLKELNYHISGRIGVDQYATMAVFILDEEKNEISYSNAAHHPLYLYRHKEGVFRSFDTRGLPIGVDKQGLFGHKRIKLNRGDYLFLFTDGLPEARNGHGEELTVEKLLLFLSDNTERKPEDLIPAVDIFLKSYSGDARQHDDQTFLALKIS